RYSTAAAMAEELSASAARLRGPGGSPAEVIEAVSVSRRLLKEGRLDDALVRLREVTARHPRSLEVRRALRTASREQQRRAKPPEPAADEFPELDATYQAAPTRRAPETVRTGGDLPATMLAAQGGAGLAASRPATAALPPPTRESARTLLWAAAIALVVALGAGALLLTRGSAGGAAKPPPGVSGVLRVRSEPSGAR